MSFNLKKHAVKGERSHEKMLGDQRKEFGHEAKDGDSALTEEKFENRPKKPSQITENQLDDSRDFVPKNITEGQLDHHKAPKDFVPTRFDNNSGKNKISPINLKSESFDQKANSDFKKAHEIDGDTELWDKYVDSQMEGKKSFGPVQVPESGNQLENRSSRFDGLTIDNSPEKVLTASLLAADVALFNVYSGKGKIGDEQKITDFKIALLKKAALKVNV